MQWSPSLSQSCRVATFLKYFSCHFNSVFPEKEPWLMKWFWKQVSTTPGWLVIRIFLPMWGYQCNYRSLEISLTGTVYCLRHRLELSESLPSVPPIHSSHWRKPLGFQDAKNCSFLFVIHIAFFFKCNCLSKTHSCFSLHLSPYHFFRNIKVWTLPWEAIEHSS